MKRTVFENFIKDSNNGQRSIFLESVKNASADFYDIFLSHSSKDKEYAIFVRKVLMDLGFTVYMDLFDPNLDPRTPDKVTGERISDVLNKCKCIFYIHSQNSELSAWCPWELGYGDGSKKKVVVLEIIDDDDYKQEFLAVYPYINYLKAKDSDQYHFWVHDRTNKEKYVNLMFYIKNDREPHLHD